MRSRVGRRASRDSGWPGIGRFLRGEGPDSASLRFVALAVYTEDLVVISGDRGKPRECVCSFVSFGDDTALDRLL